MPENEKNGDSKVVMPASGESGEQKKATFKLNKDYFTSQIHGVIKEIGIIIADVDAFDQSSKYLCQCVSRNVIDDRQMDKTTFPLCQLNRIESLGIESK